MASGYWPGTQPSYEPSLQTQQNAALQNNGQAFMSSSTSNHSTAVRNSYDKNHQTIPGLALSFSGASGGVSGFHVSPSTAATAPATGGGATSGDTEEGELSDGELEDIYEPQEQATDSSGVALAAVESRVGMPTTLDVRRDRSGSYSPYLSPGEMDTDSPEPPRHTETQTLIPQSLEEMKKRAQDAIIRLQLANVQYQDFIDEGIDKSVIDQLFGALGLEIPSLQQTNLGSKLPTAEHNAANPAEEDKMPEHAVVADNATPPNGQDKSESRKDRIARLLAAKGSTSSKTAAGATVVGKVSKPSGGVKVNAEKSKLLQRKMEALLKAREAQQQERIRQAATDTELSDAANAEEAVPGETTISIAVDHQPGQDASSSSSLNAATPTATTDVPAAKNKGSSGAVGTQFKKPFAQNRESRPFLIDVSDDDDDTDMEIDSPEQHMVRRSTSPRLTHTRGINTLRDDNALRHLSSPGSVSTPPLSKGVRGPDLASMNKKIEAMKLKIAEAEARKKAKLSHQASPADSPTLLAQGVPDDVASVDLRSASPAISPSLRDGQGLSAAAAAYGSLSPQATKGVRSRAASERLPLLESRRREQLLKLKTLQSQVANIERELKEGLAEEERLREDLDYISDDDDVEVPARSAPALAANSLKTDHLADSFRGEHIAKLRQDIQDAPEAISSDQIATDENSPYESTVPVGGGGSRGMSTVAEEDIETESGSSVAEDDALPTGGNADVGDEIDATVQDMRQTSGDDADEDSDDYEPPEATASEAEHEDAHAKSDGDFMETGSSSEDAAAAALNAELISAGRQGSVSDTERQVETSLSLV